MKTKIWMLSLGCARNLVDAEVMLGYLKKAGFGIAEDIEDAHTAILNTCCFIKEAEEESIDAILSLCRLKKEGRIKRIIVCGCLAQRYKDALAAELKEIDAFVGVGSIDKIIHVLKQLNERAVKIFAPPEFLYSHTSPRLFLTPKHFAYLKMSEGCNNHCSYCIIPGLRGKFRSRPMHSILKEADSLLNRRGVSEINLIGQDTTMYGRDLYGRKKLSRLLIKLCAKAKGRWIRLLYTHPAHWTPDLIKVIKEENPLCKYVDLPIQHISDRILKRMNRRTTRAQIFSLIDRLRGGAVSLALRSTIIVGFPGETDRDFRRLLDFMREVKFERLGIFRYSRQSGTPAYNFSGQVPEKVKQARYEEAFSVQQEISAGINQGFLGKEIRVLIDEQDKQDKNIFLGRSEYDAPEVDGCVYVHSKKKLQAGDFVRVKITDTLEYDLVGLPAGRQVVCRGER